MASKKQLELLNYSDLGRRQLVLLAQINRTALHEYDKPTLDNITHSAVALEMLEGLNNLKGLGSTI